MEAAVKVLCYKSKTLSNGEHPLMLCISKDRKRKYKSLGISVKEEYWDFNKNMPNNLCPNKEEINLLIQQELYNIQKAILNKKIEGKEFTAATLLEQESKILLHNNVDECFKYYISQLKSENRLRYAGMYDVSYNSFIKFAKHLNIPFSDITTNWLKKYECWMLKQNLAINTIGTRLRHLRAVFNMAIEAKIIDRECYPFNSYKVSKINQKTSKRAISKTDIQRVISYNGGSKMEQLAIDIFSFSYFSAGINFIDMALLTKDNITNGKICYSRSKTKKRIIIPLQDAASKIISKYAKDDNTYIFPILNDFHQTDIQKANRLHKILAKVNKILKQIGEDLNLPIKLTTYVARHSFATILKREGVPTSVISETLGHSSEKITQIYLDSFENKQIDEAFSHLK